LDPIAQDKGAVVLRRPNVDETRIGQKDVHGTAITKLSMMPEGLLDPMQSQQVSGLFVFLKSLR